MLKWNHNFIDLIGSADKSKLVVFLSLIQRETSLVASCLQTFLSNLLKLGQLLKKKEKNETDRTASYERVCICRVRKCLTALNVRQILFFSKNVI